MTKNEVAFVYDDGGNVYDWKLRSLPALQFLGLHDFTYPTSWRQLKQSWEYEKGGRQYSFPGYEYHVIGGIDLSPANDLGVITTSYYERQTQYSIKPLVDRYTTSDGCLLVVADERQFRPNKERPLYQEPFVTELGSYKYVYDTIEEAYEAANWRLPLRKTKNLFLQDNANLYELVEGERLTTAEELFEVLSENPYLPLYAVLGEIFDNPEDHGTEPLETDDTVEALGGWLRRRVEWDRTTSIDIARSLNRDVTADATMFDPSYAARSPETRDAVEAAETLDPEASRVDAQYYDWLTNHT